MNNTKLLIFSISAYITSSILTIIVSRNIKFKITDTLHDYLHTKLPLFPNDKVCTYTVYFYLIYHIIRWGLYDNRKISLYFLSLAALLIMRIITFTVTQTAPPRYNDSEWRNKHCKGNLININELCIDNMFSGHAAHIVVALAIIILYSNSSFEKIGISLITVLALLSIISSRLHYTSDVVVSIIISFLTVYFFANEYSF